MFSAISLKEKPHTLVAPIGVNFGLGRNTFVSILANGGAGKQTPRSREANHKEQGSKP